MEDDAWRFTSLENGLSLLPIMAAERVSGDDPYHPEREDTNQDGTSRAAQCRKPGLTECEDQ